MKKVDYKERCKDCISLTEYKGNWRCDEFRRYCQEIKTCPYFPDMIVEPTTPKNKECIYTFNKKRLKSDGCRVCKDNECGW